MRVKFGAWVLTAALLMSCFGVSFTTMAMQDATPPWDGTIDTTMAMQDATPPWDGTIDTTWYYDDTTATSFEISTPQELAGLSQLAATVDFTNKTITLLNDLDLDGRTFTPIGANSDSTDFNGIFDGGEHVIKNFKISTSTNSADIGLFGRVTYPGVVKNVGVENVTISATSTDTNAGGLIGYLRGTSANTMPICKNSYAKGVTFESGTSGNWGGLIGNLRGEVRNCYTVDVTFASAVTARTTASSGIGYYSTSYGSVTNFYAGKSNISKLTKIYGLARKYSASSIATNAYYDTYEDYSATSNAIAAGVRKTPEEMLALAPTLGSAFKPNTNITYHFGYPVLAWETIPNEEKWNGTDVDTRWYDTSANEYTLTTPAEFIGFGQIVAGKANNISSSTMSQKTITLGNDLDMGGFAMAPVGRANAPFAGEFDGANYVIKHALITNLYNDLELGLFARLNGADAAVKNLGLVDSKILSASAYNAVGALVGSVREGMIDQCYIRNIDFSCDVTITRLGGFVGYAIGSNVQISNSYLTGFTNNDKSITATEGGAGYGVGVIQNGAKVLNFYTAGNTCGDFDKMLGIGMYDDKSTVSNSYYDSYTAESSYHATLANTAGTKVSANELRDGAAAIGSAFTSPQTWDVNAGYPIFTWETLTLGTQSAPATLTVIASGDDFVTLSEIDRGEYSKDGIMWQQSNTFNDLSQGVHTFYGRYKANETTYSSLPIQVIFVIEPEDVSIWDGSVDTTWYHEGENDFTIQAAEQFAGLHELATDFTGVTIRLAKNLDMQYGTTLSPIDTFNGTLLGNGYEIRNLSFTDVSGDAALIRHLGDSGRVEDLGIDGITLTGVDGADQTSVAAIAAVNDGIINYCYVKNFKYSGGAYRVGALTALMNSNTAKLTNSYVLHIDLSNAYNQSDVHTKFEAIGLACGRLKEGLVSNVYVSGNMTGAPANRFNFGYTLAGDTGSFEKCYSTQYLQGGVLNPAHNTVTVKYPIGQTISVEQLQTLKKGYCDLTHAFAVDYYDSNDGYPIFEKDIPTVYISTNGDDLASGLDSDHAVATVAAALNVIPQGGKIVIVETANLSDLSPAEHIILTGGTATITEGLTAKSIVLKDLSVNMNGNICADRIVIDENVEITGLNAILADEVTIVSRISATSISGLGVLDLTDYQGYAEIMGTASGFDTVYGPVNVKTNTSSVVMMAQYTPDHTQITGIWQKSLASDEGVDLSQDVTGLSNSAHTKIFLWNDMQGMAPITKSFNLRDVHRYKEPLNVVILGNSITWHSPNANLGWDGARGMASSTDETDYVHVFESLVNEHGINAKVTAYNIACLENYYSGTEEYFNAYPLFNQIISDQPDVLIFTVGANIPNEVIYTDRFEKIVNFFNPDGSSKILLGATILNGADKVSAMQTLANRNGYGFADASDLNTSEYLATNYTDPGVALHPNDLGMQLLAERLFSEFQTLIAN
jgi:hypothetical protein